jgi:formylglycine-generating enzyme required for sulfatase activity
MMRRLLACLQRALEFDDEDIADALWLATKLDTEEPTKPSREQPGKEQSAAQQQETKAEQRSEQRQQSSESDASESKVPLHLDRSSSPHRSSSPTSHLERVPFQTPSAPPLRKSLELGRALRPLMRKVPSRTEIVLDEEATATQIAEGNFYTPVFCPAPERWLNLALVVEESPSTTIWQSTIAEVQRLVERQGAFRDVRTWSLRLSNRGEPQLFPRQGKSSASQQVRSPGELSEPSGRRLILLFSDCTSTAWQQRGIYDILTQWATEGPVALVQFLPDRLWERTALGYSFPVQFSSLLPGVPNPKLEATGLPAWESLNPAICLRLPVVTLEPEPLAQWSKVVAGVGDTHTVGYLLDAAWMLARSQEMASESTTLLASESTTLLSPEALVKRFRSTASLLAQRLAGMMAAVPISLPVIHLIQATLLPDSTQVHIAEVLMSGLLQRDRPEQESASAANIQYEFVEESIRDLLIDGVPVPTVDAVLEAVSQYIARKAGLSIRSFTALLVPQIQQESASQSEAVLPFARIAKRVLQRLGGEYAALVEELERQGTSGVGQTRVPTLLSFEFDIAEITFEISKLSTSITLQSFQFVVTTIEGELLTGLDPKNQLDAIDQATFQLKGQHFTAIERAVLEGTLLGQTYEQISQQIKNAAINPKTVGRELWQLLSSVFGEKVTKTNFAAALKRWLWQKSLRREQQERQQFVEDLGNGISLEMLAIPEGSFVMGSPDGEKERSSSEGPQHTVTLSSFFLGKCPVTQAQWRIVAALPQVNRELDPDPSRFKGETRPVECISWLDAIEFCDRLSQYTGKQYRLPSEAEWEYACRAGTTTPFHFGETITTDLANYNGDYTYGDGPKGVYRQETTPVGSFGVANAFGLYDMHGNVWEWCMDHWHENYEDAPIDGSAWIDPSASENASRLLRGGSWGSDPRYCRSAFRGRNNAGYRYDDDGFRVACSA